MKRAIAIIGTRPQFIKHFPLERACRGKIDLTTIHTGQHFDDNMSEVFFQQLGILKPNYILKSTSENHGSQIAEMIVGIEKIMQEEKPDLLILYGDTNSTLAGAIVGSKLNIDIAHIEAGLRSYNKTMPEEINRIFTDHVSKYLFVPDIVAKQNLKEEGIINGIHVCGDIMKDLLHWTQTNNLIRRPNVDCEYIYVTLHRPYNVDEQERLSYVLSSINNLNRRSYFALHPRTKERMVKYQLIPDKYKNIVFIEPQPYFENIGYMMNSSAVITDSGGMQKEAYWMNKKCITIRPETEWTETLEHDANSLIFEDLSSMQTMLEDECHFYHPGLYGEGNASQIITDILEKQ